MEFSKEIGQIIFDGYWKGGNNGDPKARQGTAAPESFDDAVSNFPFLLGKIKSTVVMTDYDNPDAFQCRVKIAEALKQNCIAIKSPNKGGHIYWFNKNQAVKVSNSGNKTVLTLSPVDYKCGIKLVKSTGAIKAADNYGCLSKPDKSFREVVYCSFTDAGELDELPFYDLPIKAGVKHDFLNMGNGQGRQDGLFTYMNPMKAAGYTYEQFKEVAEIIEQYVFDEGLGDEFENAIRQDAWDSINCADTRFGTGSRFQHNKFAAYLIDKYHIKKINGQLHIFQDGVYVPGTDAIENAMIDEIEWLKKRQRNEVLDYLALRCKECESCSFNYIAFNNGIYNIMEDTLEPFNPALIITNKIPWDYNPDAKSGLVDTVLDKLSCNDEQVRYLLEEAAGACLYRSNTLGGGKMVILLGDKANGKSTYIDMLKAMLGCSNYSTLDVSEISDRFSTAMMFGKLANLGDDISDAYIGETSQLKKIVTGNTLKAERKGQDPFDFTPYCTMLFSANTMPRINDPTGATQRRLLIVPMKAVFSKQDKDYDPAITYKLQQKECIEYFIQLAIDGLNAVVENKAFTEAQRVKDELDSYAKENNPVLAFLDGCDIETEILNERTADVYRRFEVFCNENGYKKLANNTFSKRVNAILGTKTKDIKRDKKKITVFMKDD